MSKLPNLLVTRRMGRLRRARNFEEQCPAYKNTKGGRERCQWVKGHLGKHLWPFGTWRAAQSKTPEGHDV
jgi:hypothetical protein